ncbi:Acyl-coenzyme A oxidase [Dietzia kunjamensis subsp. schimae]|uniref:Acyl-coenzyme A oxidase n=1 Tax=Dietzia kunjamensis subsp. schimae TaxID=498198 RepID=A0ABY1MYU5_9ACTN|nr:acyl-CoA dehydrogenase [Dietzia kunjamensis]MBB1014910.1 acyl-CoA oxidase [Dietzia kunjamensis subsp. schimae]SMO54924.1 Acyl-coenzyme A oxidase [Dietzia kunjamensis subsp. schimae]
MTSETDVQNAAAAGDSAPGTGPAVHPNYGRITTTGAGDSVLAASLQKVLDGTWADAREFTREAMTPDMLNPIGLGMEEHRDHVLAQLQRLADSGMPKLGFREEDGGTGDTGGALTSFEMLGHLDLSLMVKAGVQWGLFGGAIANLGDSETRKKYLPDVMSLDLLGCFAMTEVGGGSDVQNLETTATFDRETGEFVVNTPTPSAEKAYIGNAARDGRMAAVFAQLITTADDGGELRHGVHCLLVPIRDEAGNDLPGVRTSDHGPKGGLAGVDNGKIWFDDVRVPREALLDRFGAVDADGVYSSPIDSVGARFFTMLGTLIRGRVSVGAAAGASARTALALAVRYSLVRRQFDHPETGKGIPLLEYREHQRRLMPRVARAYAFACAQNAIILELDEFEKNPEAFDEVRRREMETHAAGIKASVTAFANDTIIEARLACGGAGYMAENLLTEMRKDCDVFSTFEGDNVVLTQLVGKELLSSYAADFGDMDQRETVAFALSTAVDVVQEKARASTLWQKLVDAVTDREHTDLLDRGNQLQLLVDREEHLLETVARRLRKAQGQDGSAAFKVFNSAQDHLLQAGRAHMDSWVFARFAEAVEACEDPEAREVLGMLCDLYVLDIVDGDKGWFLEHNRLTTERTKAATAARNRLCTKLAGRARTLVDAFAIPEFVFSVPMLTDGGVDAITDEPSDEHEVVGLAD